MQISLKYFYCPEHCEESGYVGFETDEVGDWEQCGECGGAITETVFTFNGSDIIGMPEEVNAQMILNLAADYLENANYHSEMDLVDSIYAAFGQGDNDCIAAMKIVELFRNYR